MVNDCDALWVRLQGGAIATFDRADIAVKDSTFQRNRASAGSGLAAISARIVKISNTTFDDVEGAFFGEAVKVQVRIILRARCLVCTVCNLAQS